MAFIITISLGTYLPVSSSEVLGHPLVIREETCSSSNLCTHVTDGSHTSTGQGLYSWSKVLNNSTRTC